MIAAERAEAYAALPWETFRARWSALPTKRERDAALRVRFRVDRGGFLKFCFPALFSRPFNRYHREALSRPKRSTTDRKPKNTLRADAAPRGIAKTTLVKGELVHDIVYELEDYIVVVSQEKRLAVGITKHIRRIFSAKRSRLVDLYGPFIVEGGVSEFRVILPSGKSIGVLARSFGTQVRGANEDGPRPTKIVIDDGEHPKRVRNPRLRREDWEFLQDDILGAGPVDGGLTVELRGTVLHPDAILPNLLKSPGWHGSLYKAIESWPERTDLWDECGAIYRDLTLGSEETRYDCARAFYIANREEMDRGASVLDDVALPLFALYVEIWTKGLRSVLRERQNEPRTAGTKFFEVDGFQRCRVVGTKATGGHVVTADGRTVPLSEIRTFMRLDPIPGKELGTMGDDGGAGAGDFACIAVLGRDKFGFGYVLDVWLRRARDSEQLAALWALGEKWRCEKATIESNGFQRLLGREFRKQQAARRAAGAYWQLTAEDDTSSDSKEDRIASLEGPITAGWLQFAEHISPEALGQFDSFPDGDHDDFPDAVEGAWRLSNTVRVGMVDSPLGAPARVRPGRSPSSGAP